MVLPLQLLFQCFHSGCSQSHYMFEEHDVDTLDSYTTAASPDQCREDCRRNEKCKFWTLSSNTCYLKSEKALENRRNQSRAVSGTNQCPGTSHISFSVFFL